MQHQQHLFTYKMPWEYLRSFFHNEKYASLLFSKITAQKMMFSINDFFSKCNQNLMENLIFCAMNLKSSGHLLLKKTHLTLDRLKKYVTQEMGV